MATANVDPTSPIYAASMSQDPEAYARFLIQQQQLQRNRALAQGLMEQTLTPYKNEEVSGRVVPYSPFQGVTKMLQAYLTGKMNTANDQQAADLGITQGQMYAAALQRMKDKENGGPTGQVTNSAPAGTGSANPSPDAASVSASPVALDDRLGSGTFGIGATNPAPVQQAPQAPAPNQTIDPQQAQAYAAQLRGMASPQPAGQIAPQPVAQAPVQQHPLDPLQAYFRRAMGNALDPDTMLLAPELAKKWGESAVGAIAPTDAVRTAVQQGQDPLLLGQYATTKAMNDATLVMDPNKTYLRPDGSVGRPVSIPEGSFLTSGQNPFGGQPPVVAPIQGAQGVLRGNASATEGGKVDETIQERPNEDGTTSKGRAGSLWPRLKKEQTSPEAFNDSYATYLKELSKPGQPQEWYDGINRELAALKDRARAAGVTLGGVSTGAPLGAKENKEAAIASGRTMIETGVKAAEGVGNAREALNQIYQLAQTHPEAFGKGSEGLATFKAYLSQVPGIDWNGAKSVQDIVGKLSAQMAGGAPTDAELANRLAALPGTDKTADAVKEIIPLLISQGQHTQARIKVMQNAATQANGDYSTVPKAAADFDLLASPRIIASGNTLVQLSHAPGANQSGTPANAKLQEYVAMLKRVGAYDRVKKLDAMGAF